MWECICTATPPQQRQPDGQPKRSSRRSNRTSSATRLPLISSTRASTLEAASRSTPISARLFWMKSRRQATMQCSTVPKIFWTPTFIRASLLPMTNGLHNMPVPAPPSMRMEYGNTPAQGEWMVSREILTAIFLIRIIRLSLQG